MGFLLLAPFEQGSLHWRSGPRRPLSTRQSWGSHARTRIASLQRQYSVAHPLSRSRPEARAFPRIAGNFRSESLRTSVINPAFSISQFSYPSIDRRNNAWRCFSIHTLFCRRNDQELLVVCELDPRLNSRAASCGSILKRASRPGERETGASDSQRERLFLTSGASKDLRFLSDSLPQAALPSARSLPPSSRPSGEGKVRAPLLALALRPKSSPGRKARRSGISVSL